MLGPLSPRVIVVVVADALVDVVVGPVVVVDVLADEGGRAVVVVVVVVDAGRDAGEMTSAAVTAAAPATRSAPSSRHPRRGLRRLRRTLPTYVTNHPRVMPRDEVERKCAAT